MPSIFHNSPCHVRSKIFLQSGRTAKEEETTDAPETVSEELPSETETDAPTEATTEEETEPVAVSDGIRPEFKEAMDSYEAFYDEYCDFMKKYQQNPTDLQLLSKYTDILTRLTEMQEKFDEWESEDLSNAELKYYLEVTNRITQKLADLT